MISGPTGPEAEFFFRTSPHAYGHVGASPGTGISRTRMSILTQGCFSTMWHSNSVRNDLPSGPLRRSSPAVWVVVAAMLVHTAAAQADSPATGRHIQQLGSPV